MRHRIGTCLSLALALAALLACSASAGARDRRTAPSLHRRGEPFTLSGSCTGLIPGEVRVDGTSYRLDPEARIYEVGKGFVPMGTNVNYRSVILSGVKVRNSLIINSVLVRSDVTPAMSAGRISPVGIRDETAPR